MKRSSANLKTLARQSLNGNFGLLVIAYLIIIAISFCLTFIVTGFIDTSVVSIITNQILLYLISLLISLLMAGYDKMFLNLNRGETRAVGNIFYAFSHNPDRFLIVNFVLLLAGVLVSLPFDILIYDAPFNTSIVLQLVSLLLRGLVDVILAAFFGLANYLLLDHPEISAMESMKESLRLMKGNKGRYVYIYFSFLPLSIACVFTCSIGLLWLVPYIRSTLAYFYMEITGELDAPESLSSESSQLNL